MYWVVADSGLEYLLSAMVGCYVVLQHIPLAVTDEAPRETTLMPDLADS